MTSKLFTKPCREKKIPECKLPQPVPPLKCISLEKFRQEALAEHNCFRRSHCVPPLILDKELNNMAQQWAMTLASKNRMESRHFHNNGENLYLGENVNVTGDMPVKRWYDQIKHYEFATPKYTMCAQHFTQVVWKNTKKLGIGVAINGKKTYVVATYHPPGNQIHRFRENVFRKTK